MGSCVCLGFYSFSVFLPLSPCTGPRWLNGMLIYSVSGFVCAMLLTHHDFPRASQTPQWLCTFPSAPLPPAEVRAEAWTLWMTELSAVRLFPDRHEVPHHIAADKFFIFSVRLVKFYVYQTRWMCWGTCDAIWGSVAARRSRASNETTCSGR